MLASLSLLVIGFLLGVRHAVDPDHVVAITTILSRRSSLRSASAVGALWGIGHTAAIVAVGGTMILFKVLIPHRAFLAAEMGVALMLVVLGVLSLRGAPSHVADSNARPVIVGTVHGLAGTGGVMAVGSPLLADPGWAMLSLLLFGTGTIAGMMLVTVVMSLPARYSPGHFQSVRGWLRYASAVVSVGFGLLLAHRVGFVDGLFLAATP